MTSTTTTRKARATKATATTTEAPKPTRSRKAATPKIETPAAQPEPTGTEATEVRLCRCGCEGAVKGKKARYIPGHDARHAGIVGRALVGADAKEAAALLAHLDTPALQQKARRISMSHAAKVAKKAEVAA